MPHPRCEFREGIDALDEPPANLRGTRNIGGLTEAALNDPETLCTTLAEWGETLEELTTKFARATGDDTSALGAEIMRSSHGLAGSIIHLLDATGIDVVRDVRVPSGRESADLEGLAESITRSILIQSKYGVFAPYRHLLETDAGEPSLSPTVDAADPHGELIGSFVLRGTESTGSGTRSRCGSRRQVTSSKMRQRSPSRLLSPTLAARRSRRR